jgi:hypothetical protein
MAKKPDAVPDTQRSQRAPLVPAIVDRPTEAPKVLPKRPGA